MYASRKYPRSGFPNIATDNAHWLKSESHFMSSIFGFGSNANHITNYDKKVTCRTGKKVLKLGLPFCEGTKRECEADYGMVTCPIPFSTFACGDDRDVCISSMADIFIATAKGLAKLASCFVAPGGAWLI